MKETRENSILKRNEAGVKLHQMYSGFLSRDYSNFGPDIFENLRGLTKNVLSS